MTELVTALRQLTDKIRQDDLDNKSMRIYTMKLSNINRDCLDWFDNVNCYPKYYWLSRENEVELCGFGQARSFTDLDQARADIELGHKVVGVQCFNDQAPQQAPQSFFIPQVLLYRHEQQWELIVNLLDNDMASLLRLLEDISYATISRSQQLAPCFMSDPVHQPDFNGWKHIIHEAIDAMQTQQLHKVVLARKTSITLESPLVASALLKISKEQNINSYHFIYAITDQRVFLGSTPERLFRRNFRQIKTEALAGTIKRGKTPQLDANLEKWLLQDAKNQDENDFVVNGIQDSLAPLVDQFNIENEYRIVKLKPVQHLKKEISGRLKVDTTDNAILRQLQPTAAIAGIPRAKALQFISHHEPFNREYYAGASGIVEKNHSEFCVMLRSLLIDKKDVHFYGGAGILQASVPETEWDEVNHKISTMLQLVTEYNLSRG